MADLAHTLFDQDGDFLAHTLANAENEITGKTIRYESGSIHLVDTGFLLIEPSTKKHNSLVLSAGIHGNETAPIELLSCLVDEVLENPGEKIKRPVLFILGHPAAMKVQKRFIDVNMNRLFCGAHQQAAYSQSPDAQRAEQIENMVHSLHTRHTITEHFDLHTAIRASEIERFALYPYRSKTESKQAAEPQSKQKQLLAACGIEALLLQTSSSTTFSSFTANAIGSESYTLELGKVKPFGQNDLDQYKNVLNALRCLIKDDDSSAGQEEPQPQSTLSTYDVCHEIINTGDSFVLHIPEDEKNFNAYPKGHTIWQDEKTRYQVQHDQEWIVFPNSRVPKGQRAGLMLSRKK